MAVNCKNINPLVHSGTSRLQRVLKALSPASAPVDGRTAADLILFAKEYASYLQYYNFQNLPDGTWQPLMQMDIAVILATLSKDNMQLYEAYRRGLYTEILSSGDEGLCKKLLEALFDALFTYIYHLDEQLGLLPDGTDEKVFIKSIITGKVNDAFQKIRAYYQEAKLAGLLNDGSVYISPVLFPPSNIQSAKVLLQQKLSDNWLDKTTTVSSLNGSDKTGMIKNLITHNLFNAAVDNLLKSIGTLSNFASAALDKSLSNNSAHTPHYALYLTFIRLFKFAQNQLNNFTGTHLQFYYKQVLQLKTKPAVPDLVRLTIELQKNTNALLIPSGTAFKAGKDADGQEIFYAVKQDFSINQIRIKAIRNLLRVNYPTLGGYQNIYKSDIANSDDGAGATLTGNDKSWATFGDGKKIKNLADIGFAIASSHFYLQEGKRVISISFTVQQKAALSNSVLQQAFKIKLTGEKGWVEVDAASIKANVSSNQVLFTVTLDPKVPAIVGYNQKVHLGKFQTPLPVLQFMLNMQRNTYNPLLVLSGLKVSNIQISTTVEGLKKLTVSTDTGAVDPAKPFMPFGASPHLGSALVLGIKEAFQKPLTDLKVLIEWDKLPAEGLDLFEKQNYPYTDGGGVLRYRKHLVNISYLENGIWVEEAETRGLFTAAELFTSDLNTAWTKRSSAKYAKTTSEFNAESWENSYDFIPCPISKFISKDVDNQAEEKFSLSSRNGFMKMELTGNDFGHDEYLDKILNPIITTTTTTSGSTSTQISNRPKPPYTPVIKSIEVNYSSSSQLDFNADASFTAFFYLTPFGFQQQTTTGFSLLPKVENEGELYIGLDGTQVPQSVSILFQVSEGSANPLKEKQPLNWSYLSTQNTWVDFDKHQFEDRTNGLLVSGLIIFQLPDNLATDAGLMGGNLAWLRVSAAQNTDAICQVIDIQPQAIDASFTDINSTGNQFKAHLPAGSISKLVVSNPLIKKITQPFDSVGGAAAEDGPAFDVRASERLRHKQRAISIWDYERLVLQQFPDIYKVKCLNHTGVSGGEWNEIYPGHVAVITIPNLKNRNTTNPLKPYTSLGKLQQVQNYLQTLSSPFVQLQAVNPQLEEVQFDFEVRFFEQYDVGVYGKLLNDSIEQFLSPWAFDLGGDIEFGGKISKSVVLKFIEDQYYVDYVSCFRMNHWVDAENNQVLKNVEEAVATTSRSILVSYHHPDSGSRHLIQPILTKTSICGCL